MAAYLNLDRMSAGEIRAMRLAMLTGLAAIDSQTPDDETLDAINTLVREAPGPRDVALTFARALAFVVSLASDEDGHAAAVVRLAVSALEAAEDVKFEIEFDDMLDHDMCHGESGGGPDPDCSYCDPEEDA